MHWIPILPGSEVDNMAEDILRIEGLTTRFFTGEGQVNAVSDFDVTIQSGEVFGLVGESGSGKSVTALSIVDLVASPGRVTDGSIYLRDPELARAVSNNGWEAADGDWVDLVALPDRVRRGLRGTTFGMIFQDPESSFNPSLTVGEQLAEAAEVQRRARSRPRDALDRNPSMDYSLGDYLLSFGTQSKQFVTEESRERAIELLEQVGIPDPVQRADEYPHEFSGGMLQRAMVAQALAGKPTMLIADEPTTALDVTIQAQVLDLLDDLQAETGMSILLITHNLGVVARMCDRVGVMYAGEVVERGTLEAVFDNPVHPYTQGLLGSIPDVDEAADRLTPIPGNVPNLLDHRMADRCYFADRCPKAMEQCLEKPPSLSTGSDGHRTKCWLAEMEYGESPALAEEYFDTEHRTGGDDR